MTVECIEDVCRESINITFGDWMALAVFIIIGLLIGLSWWLDKRENNK